MPRILIDNEPDRPCSEGEIVEVADATARYMRAVLRLRSGDAVTLFDGTGTEHEGRIREISSRRVQVEIVRSARPGRDPERPVFLAQALPKGSRMDLVVQKAVEIGCSGIYPFTSTRTVPTPDPASAEKRLGRWRKIAAEAARQCGSLRIPPIEPIAPFEARMEALGPVGGYLLWEGGETRLREVTPTAAGPIALAVGPEGGFTMEEVRTAERAGLAPVSLGPRILRTETAGLVGLSLLLYRLGELG